MFTKTTLAALVMAGAALTMGVNSASAAHSFAIIDDPVTSVLSDQGEPHVIMPRKLRPDDTRTAKKTTPQIRNDLTPEELERLREKHRNANKGKGKSAGKGKGSGCNHKYRANCR